MEELIKIKRTCKPGEVNVNGISYDLESYNKATKVFEDKIIYGISAELFLCDGYSYTDILKRQGFHYINPENCCGKIIEVTDEYITLELNNFKSGVLKDFINDGIELEAYMRYIGDTDTTPTKVINIITFDIMPVISL